MMGDLHLLVRELSELVIKLEAENKKLRKDRHPDESEGREMTDKPEDDLTAAYMYGYEKGKDKYQAENKRLRDWLDKPPKPSEKLKALLDRKVPWYDDEGELLLWQEFREICNSIEDKNGIVVWDMKSKRLGELVKLLGLKIS
jgi:hypothetical protein